MNILKKISLISGLLLANIIFTNDINSQNLDEQINTLQQEYNTILNSKITQKEALEKLSLLQSKAEKIKGDTSIKNYAVSFIGAAALTGACIYGAFKSYKEYSRLLPMYKPLEKKWHNLVELINQSEKEMKIKFGANDLKNNENYMNDHNNLSKLYKDHLSICTEMSQVSPGLNGISAFAFSIASFTGTLLIIDRYFYLKKNHTKINSLIEKIKNRIKDIENNTLNII